MNPVDGTVQSSDTQVYEPLRIAVDNNADFWNYIFEHKNEPVMIELINKDTQMVRAFLLT